MTLLLLLCGVAVQASESDSAPLQDSLPLRDEVDTADVVEAVPDATMAEQTEPFAEERITEYENSIDLDEMNTDYFLEPLSLRGGNSSNSCSTQSNCSSCMEHSYWCHWCASDQACHTKGSPFGCAIGVSCDNGDDDDNNKDKNSTDDDSHCSSHKNCSACSLSSHFCHWCAKDNACHAVGSPYGCLAGVDCFSNERCMRKQPEKATPPPLDMDEVPDLLLRWLVILITAVLFATCATYCCFLTKDHGDNEHLQVEPSPDAPATMTTPLLQQETNESSSPTEPAADTVDDAPVEDSSINPASLPASDDERGTDPPVVSLEGEPVHHVEVDEGEDMLGDEESPQEETGILSSEHRRRAPSRTRNSSVSSKRRRRHLYHPCSFCYFVSIILIATLTFGSIRFFPNIPKYAVCNDSVAWKSLVETMASMKVNADFKILASVSNLNPIQVCLDEGGGHFAHNNASIGTFDVPPLCIAPNSITDLMIVAHLSPQRWSSFNIGREYYLGRLVLGVNLQGTIRIPALFNFSFHGHLENIEVHVNQLSDRSLCHCPSWDQAKNNTPGLDFLLDFPSA